MKKNQINILIIEDSPGDFRLISEMLKESHTYSFSIKHADTFGNGLNLLEEKEFDVVLMDLNLPDNSGLSAIDKLVSKNPQIAVIVITGIDDEDIGLQAMEKLAGDYLVKGRINSSSLIRSIRYAIERKKIDNTLERERHNLQRIFDTVNIGMLLIDQDGNVERANKTAKYWAGRDEETPAASKPGNIISCIYAVTDPAGCGHTVHCHNCSINNTVKAVLNSGKPVHGVQTRATFLINATQTQLWIELNAEPLIINGIKYVVLTINDIDQNKQAEEILKRDKETFEKLVKEKTRELFITHIELDRAKRLSDIGLLAATVAHELRNPLAAIQMASYNIKRKGQNPLLDSHIKTIENKIDESEQIISNLLFYSRIKPPRYENVRIYKILLECIELAKKRFIRNKVTLSFDLKPIENTLIDIDPLQIKEVLGNVLNNAYESALSKEGKIEICGQLNKNYIEIVIRDNGEGIEEGILEMIFEPFFTTKAKGTGLGLTVCKQIIQLHGGSIEIASKKNKGSVVTIRLPKENNEK